MNEIFYKEGNSDAHIYESNKNNNFDYQSIYKAWQQYIINETVNSKSLVLTNESVITLHISRNNTYLTDRNQASAIFDFKITQISFYFEN